MSSATRTRSVINSQLGFGLQANRDRERNLSTIRAAKMIMSSDPRHPDGETKPIQDLNNTKTSFYRYDNDMYMRDTIGAARVPRKEDNS